MTEEQRRRVKDTMVDPLAELLEAQSALVASLQLSASANIEAAFRAGFQADGSNKAPIAEDAAWEAYNDRA